MGKINIHISLVGHRCAVGVFEGHACDSRWRVLRIDFIGSVNLLCIRIFKEVAYRVVVTCGGIAA